MYCPKPLLYVIITYAKSKLSTIILKRKTVMKKFKDLLSKPWAAYTFAACCAVILYTALTHFSVVSGWAHSVWGLISPVIIGVAVAYLLDPVSMFFEKKPLKKIKNESVRHIIAVVLTVICLLLVLGILLIALIPSLIQSVTKLISNWSRYTANLESLIERVSAFAQRKNINIDLTGIKDMVDNSMSKIIALLKNNTQTILSVLGSIGTSVSNFAIGMVFGVCFLVAKKGMLKGLAVIRSAVFTKERIERNNELLERCHRVFLRYIGCTLVDALIIGTGTLIFGLIMKFPYAPLIAALVGLTNIIPTFGPMIGAALGMFFLVLDKPVNAIWFLIFICVWQAIDGLVIKPKLFSESLGIPAVWTLVLIILGGKIAGALGILLAIPFAAMGVIIYNESIAPRIARRTEKINDDDDDDIEPEEK